MVKKSAYFEGTSNFVNLIEGGSYWGFDGLKLLILDIIDAVKEEKDVSLNNSKERLGLQ